MAALSGECDGARSRDGRGFSRADAQEGGRLAALKNSGRPWSSADARKAGEVAARYAKQAGDILGGGREAKASGIEAALRKGYVRCKDPVDDAQAPYNYAGFSPGGKSVYLWRMARIDDFEAFRASLKDISGLRHGTRRVDVRYGVDADLTVNGERRRAKRVEIDFNGTSSGPVLETCKRHGFVVEPALEAPVDLEVDRLRMSERAAWIHRGTRDGRRGAWAVFDLAAKHVPFAAAVKARASDPATGRRLYSCDPDDDWNWYVEWDAATRDLVRSVALEFGFSVDAEIASGAPPVA